MKDHVQPRSTMLQLLLVLRSSSCAFATSRSPDRKPRRWGPKIRMDRIVAQPGPGCAVGRHRLFDTFMTSDAAAAGTASGRGRSAGGRRGFPKLLKRLQTARSLRKPQRQRTERDPELVGAPFDCAQGRLDWCRGRLSAGRSLEAVAPTSKTERSEGLMVGATGFEPATSRSRTERSTRLSHAPRTNCCRAEGAVYRTSATPTSGSPST